MKKSLILLLTCIFALPLYAQKLTKEEKEAAAKAAYEAAVQCVEQKLFVIVPTTYTTSSGAIEDNIDKANFLSSEGEHLFAQGSIVCGNGYTNLLDATEYTVSFDKKGNMKLKIVVIGRMMNGSYSISLKNNTNVAEVIFTPSSGMTRKFTGPILPPNPADYNKRANPM